jgi:hypothetical protein
LQEEKALVLTREQSHTESGHRLGGARDTDPTPLHYALEKNTPGHSYRTDADEDR